MRRLLVAALLIFAVAGRTTAGHAFAVITAVDAEKGTVDYTTTAGKNKGPVVKVPVAKDCVLKEGYYRLGKPAVTKEGDDIPDGLKNDVFKKATAENPLKVDIYTADEDDADKGVKKGDVIKILVNPPPKKP
jgi:hypothetical protein